MLIIGWLGGADDIYAWFANLLLTVAYLLAAVNVRKGAILVLPFALALALSFLLHDEIINNEAGGHAKITGYGSGYCLWVASIAVALLGDLLAEVISMAWRWRTPPEAPPIVITAKSPLAN